MNCKCEGKNVEDPYAVRLYRKDGVIVGHISHSISGAFMLFLSHGDAIQCTETGPRKYSLFGLLQGGLELPCAYRFMTLLTFYSQNQWLTVTRYLAKNLVWHA